LNVSAGANAGDVTFLGNGLTSLTINSTGAANTVGQVWIPVNGGTTNITINAATNLTTGGVHDFMGSLTTITVSGAATKVDLGFLTAAVTTLNASGLTGGITATLDNALTSFTGGAGNDVITVSGSGLTATVAGEVNVGTGTNTLKLSSQLLTATAGAEFAGFQILSIGGWTQNVALVSGITAETITATGGGLSNLTVAQAGAVTITATDAGATFSLAAPTGTTDSLSLALTSSTASTPVDATTLSVNNFETLNVSANSGITTALTQTVVTAGTAFDHVNFTAASQLTTLRVTGADDISIDAHTNATALTTLDLSGNTSGGSVILTGGQTGALVVTGTAGNDFITVNAPGAGGTVAIHAGAGNDVITALQSVLVPSANNAIDGGTGTNTLVISDPGSVTIADNSFTNVTSIQKLVLDATTGLNFVVGGYANGIATSDGSVLNVTAASFTTLTSAVTIDASGLSGTNSLTLTENVGVADAGKLTTITASNNGADIITLSDTAAGVYSGAYTINAGLAGNKTIDLSGVLSSGLETITTGSGTDTVKTGAGTGNILFGTGTYTITLGAGHGATEIQAVGTGVSGTTNAAVVNNYTFTADSLHLIVVAPAIDAVAGSLGTAWTVAGGFATNTSGTAASFVAAATTSTTAGAVAYYDSVNNNTWVVYSDGVASAIADHVVELVGVHATALSTVGAAAATVYLS
jgi:hypothetical protein